MAVTAEELFPFADLALSRRLERAEARGNAGFVEARARLYPESGARWIEVAGAYAMYDGASSPLTQTFGLGLFEPVNGADVEAIEDFFRPSGAEVLHEVSPLADPDLASLLNERGYQPVEFTSVMFRPLRRDAHFNEPRDESIRVRLIERGEQDIWAQTSARGWSEFAEFADLMLEIGQVSAERADALSFIAEWDGQPVATGVLSIYEGVALLAGASTIPEGRRRGAQLALLNSRLRYAAERGCDLAMMCALPGSASQRNAERHGFRIAYTRIKWRLARATR
ncbi:MAG: GNAT family N-acetyltransferase [Pyrinomonadaceae bacterium]